MAVAKKTAESKGPMDSRVKYWLNEIASAKKREKDWRKTGDRILDIYNSRKPEEVPFNILFSNTETLLPALYSAVPRPLVNRRFKDDDPLGKAAGTAGQRGLEFLVDTNIDGYETFDEAVRSATLDALLPGRGITCIKYDADIGEMSESIDDEVPSNTEEVEKIEDPAKEMHPPGVVSAELVCTDTRSWNRVYFGYAKKWSKLPWIAYEEHLDETEAKRLFGSKAAKLQFTEDEATDREQYDDRRGRSGDANERDTGERKTTLVYQIWDKEGGRKIRYVSPQYGEGFLLEQDDPLELTGFFNCPRPLMFREKSNDMMPVALYLAYENQAKEVNELTRRISRISRAIKAKAVYDTELGDDIKNLMEADDNAFVPADKSSSLAAEKGLQNAIWFMPLENLITTLRELYAAREQAKSVIYEITGISDIIRGSSVASETATAQKIKSQWGTLRLKRLQKEVQRYARDLLRMMLEVAASKFSEETWAKMTGLPFVTTSDRQRLEQVVQAIQVQAAQMAAVGQQPTPQQMQEFQQLQAEMQKPVWGAVLEMLRDDTQRAYRVDIETNSTIEPEAAEDQQNITEMMTALAQYLNGIGPLVQSGVMPFGAAQGMMMAIVRRFRFGNEIEDYIKAMKPPQPQDNGEAAKKELDSQKQMMEKDAQTAQATIAAKQENSRLTMQLEKERAEREIMQRKADLDVRELKLQAEEANFEVKRGAAEEKIRGAVTQGKQTIGMERERLSMQEGSAKREQQVAQKADTAIGTGLKQIQKTVNQIAQMQQQVLSVAEQQEKAIEMVGQVLGREVVKAERVKGPDGRLARVRRHHANGETSEMEIQ